MSSRDRFHAQLRQVLKPALATEGFRAAGTTYRRVREPVIHLLNLQGSTYGERCCVNLGIHLTFLPVGGNAAKTCEPAKLTQPECEFRWRLAPAGQGDCWWTYGSSEEEARASAVSMLQLYREVGGPYFQRFSVFPDDFTRVTPAEFAGDKSGRFPEGGGLSRRALAASHIALYLGRVAEAKEFAKVGLANVGRGVGLVPKFKRILALA